MIARRHAPACRSVSRRGRGEHLVLYDGDCGLCSRVCRMILKYDKVARFDFASLQSQVGRSVLQPLGADADRLDTLYVVVHYREPAPRLLSKGRAALFVGSGLGWPWKLVRVCAVLPAAILDAIYDLVVHYRHLLFGHHDVCASPPPHQRERFLDR